MFEKSAYHNVFDSNIFHIKLHGNDGDVQFKLTFNLLCDKKCPLRANMNLFYKTLPKETYVTTIKSSLSKSNMDFFFNLMANFILFYVELAKLAALRYWHFWSKTLESFIIYFRFFFFIKTKSVKTISRSEIKKCRKVKMLRLKSFSNFTMWWNNSIETSDFLSLDHVQLI